MKTKRSWGPLVIGIIVLFGLFAFEELSPLVFSPRPVDTQENTDRRPSTAEESSLKTATSKPASGLNQTSENSIRLTFLGDIMCHPSQYEASQTDAGYDFSPSFEDIKDFTANADLTLANLETTLAGKNKTYSGYPSFNTPEQIALAIKDELGVDVVSTANNHSLDRHFSGLSSTIDFLDKFGLKHTGTFKTEKDSQEILLLEVKGFNLAFLSYTYGTNGVTLPSDKLFAVNYINREKIRLDAQKARDLGADLIIASIHWGQEYATKPSADQKALARYVFENTEVDIISGNHVHAVQPIEFLKVTRTDTNKEKEGLVIYAQGNFISDQQTDSANKGIIVDIILNINSNTGEYKVERVEYLPTWVDETPGAGPKTYRVLNVKKALTDFQTRKDALLSTEDYLEMKAYVEQLKEIIQI